MLNRLSTILRGGLAAFILALALAAAPEAARAQGSVNPTAQSVKEQQLLDALKPGAAITGRVTIPNAQAASLIQPGRDWRAFNQETLPRIGAVALLGMLALLVGFYMLRGRIRIDAGASTMRILRFGSVERVTHWLTATSFLVLALTGINVTFGKTILAPVMGPEAFAAWAGFAKLTHNFVGFAFMLGVVLTFLVWIKDNIPDSTDLGWFAAGGGLLGKGHPPAKRFNGGQKIVFWSVVVGGFFLALSGWHLLFPTQEGIADVQWHATIHGTVAYLMMALILGHIYIGSVGMEGAFDAMGSGEVDLNWAKEHHSLWVEQEMARKGTPAIIGSAQPAE
ncbi:MAG: formate dehydrogenase subunit gamma [Hyphomicrobiales bacterium]|uniref:formate dehydrogenase subunit gamma n=1 Tax=Rhabdaerophilum calidifontis TaxID=2604328 RepID=UPI00123C6BE4|nr:formate dehydrogenase subunit gamma [Rhabdaerophilum calidifontis]MCA1953500.1 formate dehydrogenase subunit gamma [Hyphomicrobiales bacterium]MCA2000206.1 formate dehydrogenase subunit gamma [Hyphomicrobiales bacterium]